MASDLTPEEIIRRRRFRRNLFRSLCVVTAIVLVGWGISPWVKIGFNCTDSVAGYVFIIVKDVPPERGELAAFWPPKNDFYHDIWFVKYVRGVAGDRVQRKDRDFYVNGQFVGTAKTNSRKGVPLDATEEGYIPAGYFYAATEHKDSFDSRYKQIGLIPYSNVIGRAYRIF